MNLKTLIDNLGENLVLVAGLVTAVAFSFYQDPVQSPVQDPAKEPTGQSKSVEEKPASDASEKDRPNRDMRQKTRRDRIERDAKQGNRPAKNNEPLTSEQQEEVEAFVRENLPELGKVLRALREKRTQQYQRAIRSVGESYARLQNIKSSGNEQAYNQALENWKIDAQIKMLSAQLTLKNNPNLQSRLEGLVSLQSEQRLSQMKVERDRLQKRMERLETSISDFENRKEGEVKRRLAAILRSTEQARKEYQAKARNKQPDKASESNATQPTETNQKDK